MSNESKQGYMATVLSTIMYGLFGVLFKLMGDAIPVFYQTFSRNSLVLLVLFTIATLTRFRIKRPNGFNLKIITVRGLVGVMSFVLCAVVFTKLPISTAYLAFYLGVLAGSYVIGSYMHHENLTSIKVVSLVLACTGMMFALGVSTVSVADISFVGGSALAGVLTSLWNILNKNIGDNYSPLELNMYDFIIGLFFTGAVSIMLGERWANPQVNAPWLANLTIGAILICTGWLIPYAYRRIEAQIGSVVGQLEIVFGIIFGAVLLHETVEIRSIIGCLLILTAGLLPYASGQLGRRQIRKQ